MKVSEKLNAVRAKAIVEVNEYYKEICGDCDYEAAIEEDKLTGEYQREVKRFTVKGIYSLIKAIRSDASLSEAEKDAAIEEIHSCAEYQENKKHAYKLIADHLVAHASVYAK